MATVTRLPQGDERVPEGAELIGYEEALDVLAEDQRFRATVYAMHALMVAKGFYTAEEFRFQFRQHAHKQLVRAKKKR